MPFGRTFGTEYKEFLTKDEVAKGHEDWAKKYGIVSVSATYKKKSNEWDNFAILMK
jgi:hypothetical protein